MRIFPRLLLSALIASAIPYTLSAQDTSTRYVVSYLEAAPGSRAQVATMLKQLADASRKEGPVRYEVLQRMSESNQFLILEMWKDQQALDRHNAAAPATQFRQQVVPLLLAPIDDRLCAAKITAPQQQGPGTVYVVTHVDVAPTTVDTAVPLMQALAADSRKDAGNVRFDAVVQTGKSNHFEVIEVWSDQKSDDDHQVAAHTKTFRTQITPLLGALYDRRAYKPL